MSIITYMRLLKELPHHSTIFPLHLLKSYSTVINTMLYNKDPRGLFIDSETQSILKSITQLQIDKVFRKTTVQDNRSEYRFMNTDEVENGFSKTIQTAVKKLQMPPLVKIKDGTEIVLCEDKALSNFSNSSFVITDITYGLRQTKRKILIREPDGTLKYPSTEISKRMKQLYTPLIGRKILAPRMFEDVNLNRCLDERKYEFILNRLTVQYEPDDAEFHRISTKVYQHINENREFDRLRSTRHFGPMAFFYCWNKCFDDLLYDMVKRCYLRNGAELIALYYKIHNIDENYKQLLHKLEKCETVENITLRHFKVRIKDKLNDDAHNQIESSIGKASEDFIIFDYTYAFINKYIKKYSIKRMQLALALQAFKELNPEKL